jgi:hypothetical protein
MLLAFKSRATPAATPTPGEKRRFCMGMQETEQQVRSPLQNLREAIRAYVQLVAIYRNNLSCINTGEESLNQFRDLTRENIAHALRSGSMLVNKLLSAAIAAGPSMCQTELDNARVALRRYIDYITPPKGCSMSEAFKFTDSMTLKKALSSEEHSSLVGTLMTLIDELAFEDLEAMRKQRN